MLVGGIWRKPEGGKTGKPESRMMSNHAYIWMDSPSPVTRHHSKLILQGGSEDDLWSAEGIA